MPNVSIHNLSKITQTPGGIKTLIISNLTTTNLSKVINAKETDTEN